MNSFMEKDTYGFGDESSNEQNTKNYETISGLGQSDYENEDLFSTEVSGNEDVQISQTMETNDYNPIYNVEIPMEYQTSSFYQPNTEVDNNFYEDKMNEQQFDSLKVFNSDYLQVGDNNVESNSDILDDNNLEQTIVENVDEQPSVETLEYSIPLEKEESEHTETGPVQEEIFVEPIIEDIKEDIPTFEEKQIVETSENNNLQENDTLEVLESTPIVEETDEEISSEPKVESNKNMLSDTSIDELNKLTEFREEKIETTDIKSLFDRVGVNVKEASDIFKKNSEMKEKIDSRFEELKKLQSEVEKSKKNQYDEINAYKEEVLGKLTDKKDEIEKRLNKLKEFQSKLEKEKEEFETYKKSEKAEIERVQKEIQEAYDGRREELSHIEDVLRKQKDALDEERSQLSLDRMQYESDKNELANNLLKFNEIVDSFTNGMDKLNKEEE